jgi:hypothetical protein
MPEEISMNDNNQARRPYDTPEIVEFGSILELTGHSFGCDIDSIVHDQFKSSALESECGPEET